MAHFHEITTAKRVKLPEINPSDTNGVVNSDKLKAEMAADQALLGELQELMYVSAANSVLIVLQGIDTSGKDGTIRHVFGGVSPLGCSVATFKVPTPEELAHDYLWRIHEQCPGKGMLTIFNRSHYESVLVERVHGLVPDRRWTQRYEEIQHFERTLHREGTIIVKVFLHISKEEQERRLRERLAEPAKQWKVAASDWQERQFWNKYQAAYEDMLSETGSEWAPWLVVPADKKWFRNLTVMKYLVKTLEPYRDDWQKALLKRGAAQTAEVRDWFARNGIKEAL